MRLIILQCIDLFIGLFSSCNSVKDLACPLGVLEIFFSGVNSGSALVNK